MQYAAIYYCVYSDAVSKRISRSPDYLFAVNASQRAKLYAAEYRKSTSSGEIAVLILPFPVEGLSDSLVTNVTASVKQNEERHKLTHLSGLDSFSK
jgi:hypothetical protein